MKKSRKVLIILLMLISLFSVCQIKRVNADSGWDSSYSGSSGGSSSSSSYDSYSSYSSSSSSSGVGLRITIGLFEFLLAYLCIVSYVNERLKKTNKTIIANRYFRVIINIVSIFVCIISALISLTSSIAVDEYTEFCLNMTIILGISLYVIIYNINFKKYNYKGISYIKTDISEEEFNKYFKYSIGQLKTILYNDFVDIQKAWMNFDYDNLKKLCSNELYNTYYAELEALKLKDGQNVMSDFNLVDNKIVSVKNQDNLVIVEYYLDIEFYDYVINTKTNEVIKGNKNNIMNNKYMLTYTMSDSTIDTCPNCGTKIETGTTNCSHCKAVIVQDSNKFVMSNKRKIN